MRSRERTTKQSSNNQISSQQRLFNTSKEVLRANPKRPPLASSPVNPLATPLYAIDAYASLQQSAIPDFPYSLPMPHTFKNNSNDDQAEANVVSSEDNLSRKRVCFPQP